jgi:hypothetical protein
LQLCFGIKYEEGVNQEGLKLTELLQLLACIDDVNAVKENTYINE